MTIVLQYARRALAVTPWPKHRRTPVRVVSGQWRGKRGVINGDFVCRKQRGITKAFVYFDGWPDLELVSLSHLILDTQSEMDLSHD